MILLGCEIPNDGLALEESTLVEMVRVAEEAGASTLWVSDHLLMVADARSRYPYSDDGLIPWDIRSDWYESLACCAWISALTQRVEVGTSVLVLSQRNPIELAKSAATIDRLSGGRFLLGVGAGWLREEVEALGFQFGTRGRRMDESIQVLRACWTGEPPAFRGAEIRLPPGVLCYPVPARQGGIPVLVGGMTESALKRAALLGDGWIAVARSDGIDEAGLEASLVKLRKLREGRDPPSRHSFRTVAKLTTVNPRTAERDVPNAARRLALLGFDEVTVNPVWTSLERARATLEATREALAASRSSP